MIITTSFLRCVTRHIVFAQSRKSLLSLTACAGAHRKRELDPRVCVGERADDDGVLALPVLNVVDIADGDHRDVQPVHG